MVVQHTYTYIHIHISAYGTCMQEAHTHITSLGGARVWWCACTHAGSPGGVGACVQSMWGQVVVVQWGGVGGSYACYIEWWGATQAWRHACLPPSLLTCARASPPRLVCVHATNLPGVQAQACNSHRHMGGACGGLWWCVPHTCVYTATATPHMALHSACMHTHTHNSREEGGRRS
jgi:hypothetical protein